MQRIQELGWEQPQYTLYTSTEQCGKRPPSVVTEGTELLLEDGRGAGLSQGKMQKGAGSQSHAHFFDRGDGFTGNIFQHISNCSF